MNEKKPGSGLVAGGIVIIALGLVAAIAVGTAIGATETNGGWATMTEYPTDDRLEKVFNWLLFLLVFGPALVLGGTAMTAGAAVNAIAITRRPANAPEAVPASTTSAPMNPSVTPAESGFAPGWYRDPYDAASYRLWDGSSWTRDVRSQTVDGS